MQKTKADLDLHKLEIFYWVAELKSFSQAAEHLSLRQPTVSSHVQELEKAVGGKLLNRVHGEVSLTPLGTLLAEKARDLVAFKRDTLAVVEQFHGEFSGELSIGGSNIPGEYVLPLKLGAFVEKYPLVKPILRIGDSTTVVDAVLEGKVELGFVGFKREHARLLFEKMWGDEMVLAVPRGHAWSRRKSVPLEALHRERFISREIGSGTLSSLRRLLAKRRQPADKLLNIAMELGSTEAVKEAVIGGFGISIVSKISIRHELNEGSLIAVRITGFKMRRDFYLVSYKGRPLSPVAQGFRSFLKAQTAR
jgi:DNA-binding transcriptional LysR family regulator